MKDLCKWPLLHGGMWRARPAVEQHEAVPVQQGFVEQEEEAEQRAGEVADWGDPPAEDGLQCRVATINPTSLAKHLTPILDAQWDIVGVSEAMIPLRDRPSLLKRFKAAHYNVIWGEASPLVTKGRGLVAQNGGVALLSKYNMAEEELPEYCHRWQRERRLVAARVQLPSLGAEVVAVAAYGHAQAGLDRRQFMEDLVKFMAETEDPWIIMGDFSTDIGEDDALQAAETMGVFVDSARYWSPAHQDLTSTIGQGAVIDHVLLHPSLVPAIAHVEVKTEPFVPAHRAVEVDLNIAAQARVFKLKKPAALDPEALRQIAKAPRAWSFLHGQLQQSLQSASMNECFRIWSTRWEQYLLHGSELAGYPVDKKHQGRGQGDTVRQEPLLLLRAHRDKMEEDTKIAARLSAHLQSILLIDDFISPEEAAEAERLWFLCPELPAWDDHRTWQECYDLAAREYRSKTDRDKQRAIRRWKEKLQKISDPYSSKSFAYVKGMLHLGVYALKDQHGNACLSPQAQDQAMHDFWDPIYQMPEDMERRNDLFLRYIDDQCPAREVWQWEPITAQMLKQSLAGMKAAGASGIDGWRPSEVRLLPDPALVELAQIMNRGRGAGAVPG